MTNKGIIFKNLKIVVVVSWIGGKRTSSAVAGSEREFKEQQARGQHTKKRKENMHQGMKNRPLILCGNYGFIEELKQSRQKKVTFLHSFVNYSKPLYLQNVF